MKHDKVFIVTHKSDAEDRVKELIETAIGAVMNDQKGQALQCLHDIKSAVEEIGEKEIECILDQHDGKRAGVEFGTPPDSDLFTIKEVLFDRSIFRYRGRKSHEK